MSGARDVRWPLFVLIVVVGLVAGLGAAYAQSRREPTLYRAETSLVIERGGQPVAGASTSRLVRTFRQLIKSHVVAADVIQSLGLTESTSTLLHRLSVAKSSNSAVLDVRAESG
ncbi:MAG TPA: hypothetical protein VG652_11170, partial [Gaiellaceae bacterium]|nr:hypothetical protein [Gaiellaceae bacterium]